MEERQIEIYQGAEGEVVFHLDANAETIWATQAQMAKLFGVDRTVVGRHLKNIYAEGELIEGVDDDGRTNAKNARVRDSEGTNAENAQVRDWQKGTCKETVVAQNEGGRIIRRKVKIYNLDAIISVGYRVNSKKATRFRIWATSVLKQYILNGVAVNEGRLKLLAQRKEIKKLHDVEDMMGIIRRLTARSELDAGEANGIIEVISRYAGSFQALKEYDTGHIDLRFMNKPRTGKELTKEMCNAAVEQLRVQVGGGDLFGKKRGGLFDGSLESIFQSFDKRELYPSVAEKAANLLYFIIKDHPFYDGNKRIGALLFILFLTINDYNLTKNGETKISDRALTAIALLIAESEPKEKGLIVSLVCKLLE